MMTTQAPAKPLRRRALAAGLVAALAPGCGAPHGSMHGAAKSPATVAPSNAPVSDDLRRARALDEQGVLAFEAGRYHDAILYFAAAFEHGGPASERWNVAKCHLRLDEPDQAETELLAYLAISALSPEDHRDGAAALEALRRRPSTLTLTSTPLGLPAIVDGRRVGTTPVSVPVSPGEHVVAVERDATTRDTRRVMAHLGRAILVEARP